MTKPQDYVLRDENSMNKIHFYCILSQCFGQLAIFAFDNGFMFTYFHHLNCGEVNLIVLLKMINITGLFLVVPLAYLSKKRGKKFMGQSGNWIQVLGMMFICSASLVEDGRIWLLYSGTILFSIGTAMFRSTWFALLAPLLSGDQRVTFFATLRTSWKLCSLGFGFFIQMMLKLYDASVYLHLISLLIFLMIIQIVYYRKIPETIEDKNENSNLKFIDVIKKVLTDPRFSCILKIKFLIPLLTGSVALVFNLYEKNILGFTADEIMFMGNSIFSGSLLGFWVGAWVVKRYGEIVVFQWTTWAMMFLGILFSLMPYIVWSVLLHASMISFSLGMCLAVIGIAETTLMLKYLPEKLETVASSIWIAITQLGFACSGLIAAFFINKFLIEDKTISEFYHVYNFLLWAFVIPLPFFAIRYTRQLKSLTAE